MGDALAPRPVKLFAGLLAPSEAGLTTAAACLEAEFGPIDLRSERWPFEATSYYRDELGEHILRQFVSFVRLVAVGQLPDVKLRTNVIERDADGRRRVNIDPGYLTLSKVVLATTKDYSHRLYLRDGIYAEVTLHYESGAWRPWPWTYRDYASGQYFDFFSRLREVLKRESPP